MVCTPTKSFMQVADYHEIIAIKAIRFFATEYFFPYEEASKFFKDNKISHTDNEDEILHKLLNYTMNQNKNISVGCLKLVIALQSYNHPDEYLEYKKQKLNI